MVTSIVEEFGGDAPPSFNIDDPEECNYMLDEQLMEVVAGIMNKCGLRFVTYIVEE